MKVAILGTGVVGRAHAERLIELGHEVFIGTRDTARTLASTEKTVTGGVPFSEWHRNNEHAKLSTFTEASENCELVINALAGHASLETLKSLRGAIGNKILIDISNPLDFSKGFPPTLSVCNTASLAEQIQEVLPDAKIIKSLNTANADVQTRPKDLADGDHHAFLSGNDEKAKDEVRKLLVQYGWKHIFDLGDITSSRGAEMILPLWTRIFGQLNSSAFNFKIVTK